jgi:hypothetical protein
VCEYPVNNAEVVMLLHMVLLVLLLLLLLLLLLWILSNFIACMPVNQLQSVREIIPASQSSCSCLSSGAILSDTVQLTIRRIEAEVNKVLFHYGSDGQVSTAWASLQKVFES